MGVRTTLLRAFYAPWLIQTLTLMHFALGAALAESPSCSSNLALPAYEANQPATRSFDAASEIVPDDEKSLRQDTATSVSRKIERFGQRMRNVEEVFSALKENLDQILGNLQDGILLFTGDGRAVLVSEAAAAIPESRT